MITHKTYSFVYKHKSPGHNQVIFIAENHLDLQDYLRQFLAYIQYHIVEHSQPWDINRYRNIFFDFHLRPDIIRFTELPRSLIGPAWLVANRTIENYAVYPRLIEIFTPVDVDILSTTLD